MFGILLAQTEGLSQYKPRKVKIYWDPIQEGSFY